MARSRRAPSPLPPRPTAPPGTLALPSYPRSSLLLNLPGSLPWKGLLAAGSLPLVVLARRGSSGGAASAGKGAARPCPRP